MNSPVQSAGRRKIKKNINPDGVESLVDMTINIDKKVQFELV